ncbi:MAG: hypothetical protein GXZ08_02505 [Tissierellia bacterium]|nr:hypothetical protein [Tissierellia bacterium]
MIDMYFNLVINGKRTCDEKNKEVILVPKKLLKTVSEKLTEEGYDLNGKLK